MSLWDSTLPESLISGLSIISIRKRIFEIAFEITKKPNKSMGGRGRYAFFSSYGMLVKNIEKIAVFLVRHGFCS
jgi:hypothetical protein